MMSNFWTVVFIFFLFSVISYVSLDLGITATIIEGAPSPDTTGDVGVLEGLVFVVKFALNNLGSFFQIITFQSPVPAAINAIVFTPIAMGMFYLGIVILRGGAS